MELNAEDRVLAVLHRHDGAVGRVGGGPQFGTKAGGHE